MTDYCVSEPSTTSTSGTAILLVHGFGAFGAQWRDNLEPLAKASGLPVFAPTFPGFGRSEKVAVPYSQNMWTEFLRDFVLQVVRQPVVIVGNSIGGFISTSLAGDYPDLCRGLVLVNSAGPIDPTFNLQSLNQSRTPPPKLVVDSVSQALFWYLERTIPGTLKWLYPTTPQRADIWLAEEIYRAACDARAVDVFKAVFYLPPPRALNYLINECWRGPTLVLQGALDPLNDSKKRAQQLEDLCPEHVTKVLLQAGHCPHDEVPQEFNGRLLEWMEVKLLLNEPLGRPTAATASLA